MAEARRRRPRAAGVRIDPSRSAAYDVLRAVRTQDAYANLALPTALHRHALIGRDAAFATELVAGTLRRQGSYDAIVDACLDRPKLEAKVRDALRLGVHQLLDMRVPDHAAITTTVDLVRVKIGPGPTGLVNAVLRRVAAQDLEAWLDQVAPGDRIADLAVRYAHPVWVIERLREALEAQGRGAELADLLTADNLAPQVVLAARPGLCEREELLTGDARETPISPWGVELPGGDPGAIPAVVQGRAGVQDEGSQIVAALLAGAAVEGPEQTWVDLCAGPGGKAALLASLGAERGVGMLAVERQPHRAGLVHHALRAVPDRTRTVLCADGTAPPWRPGSVDRVLVDVPCSGLGALRRRPESRWRRQEGVLAELAELQRDLLWSGIESLRPGGVALYATCSPVLAETAAVVTDVLRGRRDAELVDLLPTPGLDLADAAGPLPGTVQLWPHRHRSDAMFAALIRRTD